VTKVAHCDYIINRKIRSFKVELPRGGVILTRKEESRRVIKHIAGQLAEDILMDLIYAVTSGSTYLPQIDALESTLTGEEMDELLAEMKKSRDKSKDYEALPKRRFSS